MIEKAFLHPDFLLKRAPDLFRTTGEVYTPQSLGNSKAMRVSCIGIRPAVESGEVFIIVMGTPYSRRYEASVYGNNGIGTLMEITHAISFCGDLTMMRAIDIMEHCALQVEGNYANRLVFFLN